MRRALFAKVSLTTLLALSSGEPNGLHTVAQIQRVDRTRAAAEQLSADADRLAAQYRVEDSRVALKKYEQALESWKAIGDRGHVVRTLLDIAKIYRDLGDSHQWARYAQIASENARTVDDRLLEIEALVTFGTALLKQGDNSGAEQILSK